MAWREVVTFVPGLHSARRPEYCLITSGLPGWLA
jgi:hypothetical protein